jgi:citrate lyase alpha subunit
MPKNLQEIVSNKATTSIQLKWEDPASGVHANFYIEWSKTGSSVIGISVSSKSKTISGLEPGQEYEVKVYAVSNGVKSIGLSGKFSTSRYQSINCIPR